MPLPDTFVELAEAGYRHDGVWRCPSCGRRVEMFTTPRNKKMGFVLKKDSQTQYEPHIATCRPVQQRPSA